jgi:hypothetical protein
MGFLFSNRRVGHALLFRPLVVVVVDGLRRCFVVVDASGDGACLARATSYEGFSSSDDDSNCFSVGCVYFLVSPVYRSES